MVLLLALLTLLACPICRTFPLLTETHDDVNQAARNASEALLSDTNGNASVTVHSNYSSSASLNETDEFGRARLQRNARPSQADSLLRQQADLSVSQALKPIRGSKRAFNMTRLNMLKQSWCRTEVFELVVKAPGCIPKTYLNHYCYGQCNSFFIPRVSKQRNDAAFQSGATCQPARIQTVRIVLDCPLNPRKRQVRYVQDVRECKCTSSASPVASTMDFY